MFLKKFLKRTPTTRMLFFVTADSIFIPLSIVAAFFLRFEGAIPFQYYNVIQLLVILNLAVIIPFFFLSKLYSFSWSYVSTEELVSLAKALVISYAILGAALFILKDDPIFLGFPRSTLFISFFLIAISTGGIRFSKRVYLQTFKKRFDKSKKERTLIVGAGDAGEQILRSILSLRSIFFPVGFVDDNQIKQGVLIHGLQVLGRIDDIPKIVQEKQIEIMIVALPSAGSEVIKEAVEKGRKAGLKKIKIIPPLAEIAGGKISLGDLKDIRIEDLLGRKPVSLDFSSIEKFIKDKKILITGAAGSIGSELCRQIAKFDPTLLLLIDQDETGIFNIAKELKEVFPSLEFKSQICDIRDEKKLNYIFEKFNPQVLFHAAAYKHVPLMEEHPDEAVTNNILGTKKIAEIALRNNLEKFIFISTDKAVKPSSVMGASKRTGEMICQALNKKSDTKFISVRFGNVLDSRGSVIPIFRNQIKKGGPVEITHPEMKRYFMMTSEACLLVMQAAEMGIGGEVFILDMGKPIKIIDLAKEMIRLSGHEPDKDIPIVFTKPRPGEKLFEEILTSEEGIIATQRQKIFSAKLSEVNEQDLLAGIKELNEAALKRDKDQIKRVLKNIIPSYNNLPLI